MSSRSPLDWNAPGPIEPDPPPGPADVIVPVYGAAAELAACLASLRRNTDFSRHRLILVIDGPQGEDVEEALRGAPETALVLRNPERKGFVGSVNRGMRGTPESDRDVILLNSDTEVTPGWAEKLQAAAFSHPAIATVTPFSNNATIASLPRFAEVNALPAGWSADRFAALVERVSARERPRLPTGVGVCLYIKRKALGRLGLFDEERFGLGYGEESEFCFRALKAGFLNVLDDATFIYHAGQRSFGSTRSGRVRTAHRAMERLHPEYLPTVAAFLRRDPLRPARERVLAELRRSGNGGRPLRLRGPRRILHLVHGWPPWNPAGTEVYARRLARRQTAWREVTVYARVGDPGRGLGEATELWDRGARVRLVVNNFTQRDPLSRNALHDRRLAADFRKLLTEADPELVHVHHLAGHAVSLLGEAARRKIPILYQVQDWWAPCARANLLDARRRLCSGPAPRKCAACLPMTGFPPAALLNPALYAARERLTRRALRRADAFVMGSRAILESYLELGWLLPEDRAFVIPYGIERPPERGEPRRRPGSPLRFGLIGSILPHKGIHLAVAAFRGIDPARATLQVWGDPRISPAYAAELEALASPAVRLEGRFDEERRGEIFAGLDVLVVPSLGLESFGLVAREALAEGVPVLAARRGALAELFDEAAGEDRPCGALFDPEDPEELRGWIARLAENPGIVAGWAANPPRVKEMDEHAEEIEAVYEKLLST